MVEILQQQFGSEVHIALLSVQGPVSDDSPYFSPGRVAEKAWGLWDQSKGEWEGEEEMVEGGK